jgi:hypothetical protein
MKWTKAGGQELLGLVKHRQAECAIWQTVDKHSDDEQDRRLSQIPFQKLRKSP